LTGLVLVTGAAGRVGRALLPALAGAGWRTRALVHRRPVLGADETVAGDLADPGSLAPALDGVDAVVHVAAVTHARSAPAYDAVNVAGTRNLLAAARHVKRFLHVSTRAIDPSGGAYSRSKAEAERLVRDSSLPFTIVRLPEIYGAGGREGVDAIVARTRTGRPVPLVGDGSHEVCPIPLADAVGALVAALAADAALGRTYTLAGHCLTLRAFAERCAAVFGSRVAVIGVPVPAVAALSALARFAPLPLYPDQLARLRSPKPRGSDEAARDLGFRPRPLEEGLRDLVL
jgi:nucleoside-diphosphate-sugar epimerase